MFFPPGLDGGDGLETQAARTAPAAPIKATRIWI